MDFGANGLEFKSYLCHLEASVLYFSLLLPQGRENENNTEELVCFDSSLQDDPQSFSPPGIRVLV